MYALCTLLLHSSSELDRQQHTLELRVRQSERVAADNDGLFDSFNDAAIRGPGNELGNETIACDNTDSTNAFTRAQIVVSGAPSPIFSTTTTIASDNHDVHDVFEGAKVNIPATQSTSIASGNKNLSRSFQGFRVGSEESHAQVGSRTLHETKQGSNLSGHAPPPYSILQSDPSLEVEESVIQQWCHYGYSVCLSALRKLNDK